MFYGGDLKVINLFDTTKKPACRLTYVMNICFKFIVTIFFQLNVGKSPDIYIVLISLAGITFHFGAQYIRKTLKGKVFEGLISEYHSSVNNPSHTWKTLKLLDFKRCHFLFAGYVNLKEEYVKYISLIQIKRNPRRLPSLNSTKKDLASLSTSVLSFVPIYKMKIARVQSG